MRRILFLGFVLVVIFSSGCTTYKTRVDNTAGRATVYEDVSTSGKVAGVGMESQDVISLSDKMVRDLLAEPMIAGRSIPPRIILDSNNFRNEGTDRINKNIITRKMRTALNRAAKGKIYFVDREASQVVQGERGLKRAGAVDAGTIRMTATTLGADFLLKGEMMTMDAAGSRGKLSRYHLINFDMIDLESQAIIWSNDYEFRKSAQENIVYQ